MPVYTETPSGGVLLAGTASLSIDFVTLGGISVGDITTHAGGVHNLPANGIAENSVKVAGQATRLDQRILTYTATGNVVLDGESDAGITEFFYTGRGNISVGNENSPTITNVKFVKNTTFLWRKEAIIKGSLTALWNTGRLRMYWYRIIGKGLPGDECGPLQADPCCQKFVMNVHARTLGELCEKLSNRRYKFPIDSVQRFSRPAETAVLAADEAAGIDHDCNKLETIELCAIPQCAEFCIGHDKLQKVKFGIKAQIDAFFDYESEGSIYLSGTSPCTLVKNLPAFTHEVSGSITISGTAVAIPSHYSGQGGAIIGGAAKTAFSRHSYTGGVWPNITKRSFGTSVDVLDVQANDKPWSLTNRILTDNGLYTQVDVSFGKSSQFIIVRGFNLNLPSWASILGLRVRIDRFSTQIGVRDKEIYLVKGTDIISDNLAITGIDWPLLETSKIYGSNGIDGLTPWRDIEGDGYLGPFAVDDLNDADFGVAIRIQATNSLPATIARIDYVNVEAFYELETGSIIRIGGESTVVSPVHHYNSYGKLVLESRSTYKKGLRYVANGKNEIGAAGIAVTGQALYGFGERPQGGIGCGGEAKVSPFLYEMSGGIKCGLEALVKPYHEVMSGGLIVGGKALRSEHYHYNGSGQITISGQSFTPEEKLSYTATGSVIISGTSGIKSSRWIYVSDQPHIYLSGTAGQKPSDLGTKTTVIDFGMQLLQLGSIFAGDIHKGNAKTLTGSLVKCGCTALPFVINLTHNFARNNIFSKFLIRNNKTIARTLGMNYNQINDSWQSNLHYKGLSPDSNTMESWNMVFDLTCADSMGGINIGRKIWKLGLQITRKNLTTYEDFETRIVIGIMPDLVCGPNADSLNVQVTYDTQIDLAIASPNASIYQNTLFDNIGLFKNSAWISDPDLVLRLSQSNEVKAATRIDMTETILV